MSDWRDVMKARSAADAALREIDPSRVLEEERVPVLGDAERYRLWLGAPESPQDAEGRP